MFEPELVAEIRNADISQNGQLILKDINFSMAKAEFCYLIGKTGSGKSSFLKTLYGAKPLLSGEGQVAGSDLSLLDHRSLPKFRRKIGMVFQEFKLFNDWTVSQNLEYVLEATGWLDADKMSHRIAEVLEGVDLLGKEQEPVRELSGGEQQRLAMARAMLNYPQLIIADEPTGNLDPDSADNILYLLREFTHKHKTSILLATHDYRLIKKFPARVYRCQEGSLIEV